MPVGVIRSGVRFVLSSSRIVVRKGEANIPPSLNTNNNNNNRGVSFVRLCSTDLSSEFRMEKLTGTQKGIVVFRMNRPKAMNAISKNLYSLMNEAVQSVKFDKSARVIVLKSDVKGAFCAGADLKERVKMAAEEVPVFVSKARQLMSDLENLPQPVIAALDGVALGGGLEMALACDLRVSASSAKMGLVETKLAIIPGAGGTQRLPRIVGIPLAKELIFTSKILKGDEALKISLVNRNVEQNETGDGAYQEALKLAQEILPNGPVALKAAKMAINQGSQTDIQSALNIEKLCYAQVIPTNDRLEGLKAFKEKRTPQYTGE